MFYCNPSSRVPVVHISVFCWVYAAPPRKFLLSKPFWHQINWNNPKFLEIGLLVEYKYNFIITCWHFSLCVFAGSEASLQTALSTLAQPFHV